MCELCDKKLSPEGRARRRVIIGGATAGAMLLAAPVALAEQPRILSF